MSQIQSLNSSNMKNAIVCICQDTHDARLRRYIYLNSCLPIYMLKNTKDTSCPEEVYKLVKFVNGSYHREEEDPNPIIDTQVLAPSFIAEMTQKYKTEDVSLYASFNDIFAVRMALAKYSKQKHR